MYLTDESMEEFAQWQHDAMCETPEVTDSEVIRETDIADCVHDWATVTEFTSMTVWECPDCGHYGQLGKEY